MATVDVEKNTFPFEFKHVALGGNQAIQWEGNENRRVTVSKWSDASIPSVVIVDSWHLTFADVAFHWAGVFVRLNQVRYGESFFDFGSLKCITEWALEVGFAAVHFVGLFDTTGLQPHFEELPVSGFAINPFYLDLSPFNFRPTGQDEKAVLREKLDFLRKMWVSEKDKVHPGLKQFVENNRFWLTAYETLIMFNISVLRN
jgi:hypothetical protein